VLEALGFVLLAEATRRGHTVTRSGESFVVRAKDGRSIIVRSSSVI
jgi:hypothetical protein